ncbi:MAG: transporter [Nitrospirae bacterium]|nr:transporter [Candidatus Troglogloeales bacterium]
MKSFLLLAVLFLVLPSFAFGEAPFLVTESAIPIDKESYRVDGEVRFDKASTQITTLSTSLRYGLINNLEIAATLPYLFANNDTGSRNQFGDVLLAAKVRFIKGREANPLSIGGSMQVKVPFEGQSSLTTGEADVGFFALATKEIAPYEAHLNLGYTFIGNPPGADLPDRFNYALGLDYKEFRPNLSLMGELFGTANTSGPSHDEWSGALSAGRFVRPDFRVSGTLGIGLSDHAPDYILNLRGSYFF